MFACTNLNLASTYFNNGKSVRSELTLDGIEIREIPQRNAIVVLLLYAVYLRTVISERIFQNMLNKTASDE